MGDDEQFRISLKAIDDDLWRDKVENGVLTEMKRLGDHVDKRLGEIEKDNRKKMDKIAKRQDRHMAAVEKFLALIAKRIK